MTRLPRVLEPLADLLWPPRCAACGTRFNTTGGPGHVRRAFCARCAESLIEVVSPRCPRCALPYDGAGADHLCPGCLRSPPPFIAAEARFVYGGSAAAALARFKYGPRAALGRPLAELLLPLIADVPPPDMVVPIPLHPRQLSSRGFNQSALIARTLTRQIGSRLAAWALLRTTDTAAQASLDRRGRLANMKQAFVAPRRIHAGSRVLLVDDVITTTATIRAATEALIAAGAGSVRAVALARTGDGPAVAASNQKS
jgi:ComF family protein